MMRVLTLCLKNICINDERQHLSLSSGIYIYIYIWNLICSTFKCEALYLYIPLFLL